MNPPNHQCSDDCCHSEPMPPPSDPAAFAAAISRKTAKNIVVHIPRRAIMQMKGGRFEVIASHPTWFCLAAAPAPHRPEMLNKGETLAIFGGTFTVTSHFYNKGDRFRITANKGTKINPKPLPVR